MTDEYRDPIEEREKVAKDPETATPAPNDWPRTSPENAPAEPTDGDSETQPGLEPA